MRCFLKLWLILVVPACLCVPCTAEAQSRVRTSGGSGNFRGSESRFRTFGGFGNFGGFGFGGFGFPAFGNWGGFGWTPGFAAPFGIGPGFPYFNQGWTYPSPYSAYPYSAYGNGYDRFDAVPIPGFAASEPVRSRAMLYPAIPEPSREVIRAALEGDIQSKGGRR